MFTDEEYKALTAILKASITLQKGREGRSKFKAIQRRLDQDGKRLKRTDKVWLGMMITSFLASGENKTDEKSIQLKTLLMNLGGRLYESSGIVAC